MHTWIPWDSKFVCSRRYCITLCVWFWKNCPKERISDAVPRFLSLFFPVSLSLRILWSLPVFFLSLSRVPVPSVFLYTTNCPVLQNSGPSCLALSSSATRLFSNDFPSSCLFPFCCRLALPGPPENSVVAHLSRTIIVQGLNSIRGKCLSVFVSLIVYWTTYCFFNWKLEFRKMPL